MKTERPRRSARLTVRPSRRAHAARHAGHRGIPLTTKLAGNLLDDRFPFTQSVQREFDRGIKISVGLSYAY